MKNWNIKMLLILFVVTTKLRSQDLQELKMTFPSIYFKHNSTEYALMPYSVDSCFKHIALLFDKNVNDLAIWRDSSEAESLTRERIKKLEKTLTGYIRSGKPKVCSMGNAQKISRRTIAMTNDSSKIKYLLALNSVFEVSKTHIPENSKSLDHILHPKIWCWHCWISGFHIDKRSREYRKTARLHKQNQKAGK